jgi:hypothetical protein
VWHGFVMAEYFRHDWRLACVVVVHAGDFLKRAQLNRASSLNITVSLSACDRYNRSGGGSFSFIARMMDQFNFACSNSPASMDSE